MRSVFLVVCLTVMAFTSGCATAVRGTTEEINFGSDPSGAKMTTSTGKTCITPCKLVIERKETFTAKFELGDETKEVFVDTEVDDAAAATTAANILFTPIIAIPAAIIVDAASGANLSHTPNPVLVKFETDSAFAAAAKARKNEVAAAKSGATKVKAGATTASTGAATKASNTATTATTASATTKPKKLPVHCTASPGNGYWREECQEEPTRKAKKPKRKTDNRTPADLPAYCRGRPQLENFRDECKIE